MYGDALHSLTMDFNTFSRVEWRNFLLLDIPKLCMLLPPCLLTLFISALNGFKWEQFFTMARIFIIRQHRKSCEFSCCINPSLLHSMSLLLFKFHNFLRETTQIFLCTFITSSKTLIYIICYHHTLAYIRDEINWRLCVCDNGWENFEFIDFIDTREIFEKFFEKIC